MLTDQLVRAPWAPSRPTASATLNEVRVLLTKRLMRRAVFTPTGPAAPPLATGPVLVIPSVFRADDQTQALRDELSHNGHATFGWELGVNRGPVPALRTGAAERLLGLYADHGPVNLVGLSMGGLFCRWLAHRHPHAVRQVLTVCSPFRSSPDSCFVPVRGLLKRMLGDDLTPLATEVERALPVPGTFVYTRQDGIVAWQCCMDPAVPDDCFEIAGTHIMIAIDPAVRAILLSRLARPLGSP